MSAEDSAARQASKEAEEARKIRMSQESHDVDTLCVMFPALEREVVIDVVRANEGRSVDIVMHFEIMLTSLKDRECCRCMFGFIWLKWLYKHIITFNNQQSSVHIMVSLK